MRREPTCVGHGTATRAQTCGLEAALEALWLANWDAVNEMCVRRSSGRRKSLNRLYDLCGESRRVWDMAQRPERRPAGSRLHWKRCGLPIGVL